MARFLPPTKWKFHNRVLLALALFALGLAGPYFAPWWEMTDFDPRPTITLGFIGTWGSVISWGLLLIWLFFFSYVPLKIRVGLLVVFVVYLAMIDDVTLNSYRQPVLHYRWQSRPADVLARYLEEQPAEGNVDPQVDLRVDLINDYPRFRGVRGDGVANPTELLEFQWDKHTPRKVWHHPCGGGFAGFAVAGKAAVTLEQRGNEETVVCYDRETGLQLWAHGYEAAFRHITGNGPRATPTISDGKVYTLGALGRLTCLDGATGKRLWYRDILDDARAKLVAWGVASSPLVVDNLVIVNAGTDPRQNAEKAVIAYRVADGSIAWASGSHAAGYSSPVLATLAGKRQVVLFDNEGLAGYDLDGGAELWRYPWPSETDGNVTQPLFFDGSRVFISSETNRGCAMVRVGRTADGFGVEKVWSSLDLCSRYANPVAMGRAIYGLSSGYLVCLDAETGKRYWRSRRCYRNGQVIGVSGHVLVQSEDGEIVVVTADTKALNVRATVKIFNDRTWNTPALAGRWLYLRNEAEMACYELPLRE